MKKILLKVTLVLAGLIVLVDLGFLNWKVLQEKKPFEGISPGEEKNLEVPPTPQATTSSVCPLSCLSQIYEATASLKWQATPGVQPGEKPLASTGVREFTISFGSGSSTADNWTDVPGVEAYIDSTKYGRIKSVIFEASLYIPTGNQIAWVRLFNVTDKHPVWLSELSLSGGEPKLLTSQPLTLSPGNKLYRVQMKTQLKALTQLAQARVKITTE